MQLKLYETTRLLHLLKAFCHAVQAHHPAHQTIDRPGSEASYITRWFIGRKMTVPVHVDSPDRTPAFVENLYLHEYGRGDKEDLHTHPWDNASLIVHGNYVEEDEDGIQHTRLPGDIILRRADQAHRIIEVEPGTLTLFATLKKGQEGGFIVDGEFVHWKEYPLTATSDSPTS